MGDHTSGLSLSRATCSWRSVGHCPSTHPTELPARHHVFSWTSAWGSIFPFPTMFSWRKRWKRVSQIRNKNGESSWRFNFTRRFLRKKTNLYSLYSLHMYGHTKIFEFINYTSRKSHTDENLSRLWNPLHGPVTLEWFQCIQAWDWPIWPHLCRAEPFPLSTTKVQVPPISVLGLHHV